MTTANLVCEASGGGGGARPGSCAFCKGVHDRLHDEGGDADTQLVPIPNPVKRDGELFLNAARIDGKRVDIEIFDVTGAGVRHQTAGLPDGAARIPVAISGLPPGHYVVHVTDGTRRYNGRLIINQ